YLSWVNILIRQEVRGMRAQQDLSTSLSLQPPEHLRDVAHHVGMEGQLWLFEKEWAQALKQRPQQAHESKCPVREVFLGLPRTLRPPVLVLAPQVGCPVGISP